MKNKDYIRYANCHEDANNLSKFIKNKGVALSIASGGDNSFYLLGCGFDKVYVIDQNIAQLYLTQLKLIAMQHLTKEEYLEFIGFTKGKPLKLYYKLSLFLDKDLKTYFDKHLSIIKKGICYSGKFEKYLRFFARFILPLTNSKKKIKKLVSFDNLEHQAIYFKDTFLNKRFKLIFKLFFSKASMKKGRDKSCFKYVEDDIPTALLKRITIGFTNVLNKTNPYLALPITGKFQTLLPYLEEGMYEQVVKNLNKITFIHGDISIIDELDVNFDFFNLSDIFEYMSIEDTQTIEQSILNKCNPDARVLFYNMINERSFKSKRLKQLNTKEAYLKDRAFYYMKTYAYAYHGDNND